MALPAFGAIMNIMSTYAGTMGQAKMYDAQADVQNKLATASRMAADVTEYGGGRAAAGVGLQYRAALGRLAVGYGAGNIAGRTTGDVMGSEKAIAQLSEHETFNKYMETAYQERLRGAEETAAAGRYTAAAQGLRSAAPWAAAGAAATDVSQIVSQGFAAMQTAPSPSPGPASVAGDSGSVDPKWKQASAMIFGG